VISILSIKTSLANRLIVIVSGRAPYSSLLSSQILYPATFVVGVELGVGVGLGVAVGVTVGVGVGGGGVGDGRSGSSISFIIV